VGHPNSITKRAQDQAFDMRHELVTYLPKKRYIAFFCGTGPSPWVELEQEGNVGDGIGKMTYNEYRPNEDTKFIEPPSNFTEVHDRESQAMVNLVTAVRRRGADLL